MPGTPTTAKYRILGVQHAALLLPSSGLVVEHDMHFINKVAFNFATQDVAFEGDQQVVRRYLLNGITIAVTLDTFDLAAVCAAIGKVEITPIAAPVSVPTITTATTGGTIVAGVYTVGVSNVTALGESAVTTGTVTVPSGTSTNTITVPSITPATGVTSLKYYLSIPGGTTPLYYGGTNTDGSAFTFTAPASTSAAVPPAILPTGVKGRTYFGENAETQGTRCGILAQTVAENLTTGLYETLRVVAPITTLTIVQAPDLGYNAKAPMLLNFGAEKTVLDVANLDLPGVPADGAYWYIDRIY